MVAYDQQLHGYRQGHQLLSTTLRMPKADQDLLDRLSDVAGPLSPGERFPPYVTLYPLPSGSHYVVARTWQDFDAPRAGCVRTRSVLIPMVHWQEAKDIAAIVALATAGGADGPATRATATPPTAALPAVDPEEGTELIEAVFLEDRVPIVVFDAPRGEVIAVRLATALWPGLRRQFTLSTFARSPRTIGRRSFDLVFAPSESRSRFSDWKGRRIDGRKGGVPRHPWSRPIVDQVLRAATPSLASLDTLGEMSRDGTGSESALRVSLLWDDLQRKLPTSPMAALGLLDIANTRKSRDSQLIRRLEPALVMSARAAADGMNPADAWRHLAALIQKLDGHRPSRELTKGIAATAEDLAARHPLETTAVLGIINIDPQRRLLMGAAAEGLSRSIDHETAEALSRIDGRDLLDLLLASDHLAKSTVDRFPVFSTVLASTLTTAPIAVREQARSLLLGLLVDDRHVEPARVLMADLNVEGLIAEAGLLNGANGLSSPALREVLLERARALGGDCALREAVSGWGNSEGVAAIVDATLHPTAGDLGWVLTARSLGEDRRLQLVRRLVSNAGALQLRSMLASPPVVRQVVELLDRHDRGDARLLSRIAYDVTMPSRDYLSLVVDLLPKLEGDVGVGLVGKAIELALPLEISDVSAKMLDVLLKAGGSRINGAKAALVGLRRDVSTAAASRNLVAFDSAPGPARGQLLSAIDSMADALVTRRGVDVSTPAAEAAAALLWDSRLKNQGGFLRASATLVPFVLADRGQAASPLIAAAFPPVYRELARDNGAYDSILAFFFVFVDWDKCKSARRRLVNAFVHSDWRISDIAVAAVRADDAVRILGRVANERGGRAVLQELNGRLGKLPDPYRKPVKAALKTLGVSK